MGLAAQESCRKKDFLSPLLVILTSIPLTTSYSITYFDCDHITQLATYQLSKVCKPLKTASEMPETNSTIPMQVLQRVTTTQKKWWAPNSPIIVEPMGT